MPVKYTDEMCIEARKQRAAGVKWSVLDAQYGRGIRVAVSRLRARERKAASREGKGRVELNLPDGTAAALKRVCEAACDAPVALLSQQIHKLDQLLAGDREAFDMWVRYGTNVANVAARHIDRIGGSDD